MGLCAEKGLQSLPILSFNDFSSLVPIWDKPPGKQRAYVPVSKEVVCRLSPSVCTHSEISCKNLEGQEGLRQLIFHVTCNMKDVGSTIGCQKLAGRLVSIPASGQVRGSFLLSTIGIHASNPVCNKAYGCV